MFEKRLNFFRKISSNLLTNELFYDIIKVQNKGGKKHGTVLQTNNY